MDIVFVVLHYQARVDTEECIGSILDLIDTNEFKIIIVDNCSPDNSYMELLEEYQDNDKIILIHNDENLGYAKGNNVGIIYAREHFDPRFVVIMNNDTCLLQTHLFENLCAAEDKYRFAVLGPLIITADGKCSANPFSCEVLSREMTEKMIRDFEHRAFIYRHSLERIAYGRLRRVWERLKHPFRKPINHEWGEYKPKENCALHGSFLVFSRTYFEVFNGFDPRTFLYMEENILFAHIVYNGLSSLYYPGIAVYHKEDASTNSIIRNEREKQIFILREHIKSAKKYLTVLNEYDERKQAGSGKTAAL